jgi:ATP-binding cassette subfamily B multidrug efflux pump
MGKKNAEKSNGRQLIRILSFVGPYRLQSIVAVLLLLGSVLAELVQPRLIQRVIDDGISAGNINVITVTVGIMIALAVFEAGMTIANTFMAVRVAQNFAHDVRSSVFRQIQKFSFGNLDKFQTGELVVRLSSDVNIMQMMVMMLLRIFVRAPIIIVGSIVMMLTINLQLASVMLLLLPLTLVLATIFVVKGQPLFLGVQRRLDKVNMVLQENLAGIRVVKSFVRMDREIKRFGDANEDLYSQQVKVTTLFSVLFPSMLLIINVSILGVIWLGGQQVIAGSFTVGEIVAFTNYLLTSIFPLLFLAIMASQVSAANASAQRIYEVIDSKPKVVEKPEAIPLKEVNGRVAFEDVCFSYTDDCREPVLSQINFVAEPGETVAILGATGSGKTTLVNLIPRFYDATRGRVTIDGIDVRDVTIQSLRENVGVSLQEPILFSGTLKENIAYGKPDASAEEIDAVARASQSLEFIESAPKGYETDVGHRGAGLSGGQKQRVAIARALLVKPKILILDDSTSSVDVQTEAKIQEALDAMMGKSTVFIIAQRISTVLKADKIIVLEKGKVVAIGNHAQLMRESPIYKEIYDSQLGGGIRA